MADVSLLKDRLKSPCADSEIQLLPLAPKRDMIILALMTDGHSWRSYLACL